MFFLGHMTWAYVWAEISAGKRRGELFVPMILTLGVIPDIDLFLQGLGVWHHTITHSFLFWLIIFAPLVVVFRRKVFPYFVAVAQHFAFGDLLAGAVMIFWPFSQQYFGFNIRMASTFEVILEATGLLLAGGISYFNGDLKQLLSVHINNIFMLPLLIVIVISLVAVEGYRLPTSMVLLHIILVVFLAFSTVQGLRKLFNKN